MQMTPADWDQIKNDLEEIIEEGLEALVGIRGLNYEHRSSDPQIRQSWKAIERTLREMVTSAILTKAKLEERT